MVTVINDVCWAIDMKMLKRCSRSCVAYADKRPGRRREEGRRLWARRHDEVSDREGERWRKRWVGGLPGPVVPRRKGGKGECIQV